jgi:hypothetical protein
MYGPHQFQLEIPLEAFEGKKIVECKSGVPHDFEMPPDVDLMAAVPSWATDGATWFVFKPESADWLNKSATVADFDAPGEPLEWS